MARRDAAEFTLEHLPVADDGPPESVRGLIERLLLVVSELATNAVEAAPGLWFRLEIAIEERAEPVARPDRPSFKAVCTVTNPVADEEPGPLRFGAVPEPLAERGRGLLIVDELADRCRHERTRSNTIVTAELFLDP